LGFLVRPLPADGSPDGLGCGRIPGTLTVGKLEADPNPVSRDGCRVQGLPTLILFRDGQEVARHEGAMARPQLKGFLDAHL
jgi:thioredoxin 1